MSRLALHASFKVVTPQRIARSVATRQCQAGGGKIAAIAPSRSVGAAAGLGLATSCRRLGPPEWVSARRANAPLALAGVEEDGTHRFLTERGSGAVRWQPFALAKANVKKPSGGWHAVSSGALRVKLSSNAAVSVA